MVDQTKLGNHITLNTSFEEAIENVTEALKTEGFGVLTEIDVKAVFKKKLDVDRRPYTILGACNPKLAQRALEVTEEVGMLLPCNVTVSQNEDDSIRVSFVNPEQMLGVINESVLEELACEVKERLDRVAASLA